MPRRNVMIYNAHS